MKGDHALNVLIQTLRNHFIHYLRGRHLAGHLEMLFKERGK